MDLSTPRRQKRLKHQYLGKGVQTGAVRYKPILITQFEIADSTLHAGKDMLVAQIHWLEDGAIETHPLFAEGYKLIETVQGTEESLPHFTKIVRKRDGYDYFTPLNAKEKEPLIALYNELSKR